MIQYRCDMCYEIVNKKYLYVINNFPRVNRSYITDSIGTKLKCIDGLEFMETHLCIGCCRKLSLILPVVEPD